MSKRIYNLGLFVKNSEIEAAKQKLKNFHELEYGSLEDFLIDDYHKEIIADHFAKKYLDPYKEFLDIDISTNFTKEELINNGKEFMKNCVYPGEAIAHIDNLYNKEKSKIELIDIFNNLSYYDIGLEIKRRELIDKENIKPKRNLNMTWKFFQLEFRNKILLNKYGEKSYIERLQDMDFERMYLDERERLKDIYNKPRENEQYEIYRYLFKMPWNLSLDDFLEREFKESNILDLDAAIIDDKWYEHCHFCNNSFHRLIDWSLKKYRDTHTLIHLTCYKIDKESLMRSFRE